MPIIIQKTILMIGFLTLSLNLASTCTFFFSNKTLMGLIQDKRPKYKIAAGERHTLILHYDGSLFGFGLNMYGQLGLGHPNQQLTPQCLILPKEDIKLNHQEDDGMDSPTFQKAS
jgi:hypothetical protein